MGQPPDDLDALKAQVAALTARVYQLEQLSDVAPEARQREIPQVRRETPASPSETAFVSPSVQPASGSPVSGARPGPPPGRPVRRPLTIPTGEDADLEKKIGQYWLNRIGIVAILFGVSYFLKYAFENNWIGPGGRIVIGLIAGIALVLWSERFRSRGHATFSYSLKAVGIGTLYLSLWGAFQIYHLIPAAAAFMAMVVVTAATIALALSQDAELLASFALAGGFATPALLSTGQNHEVVLFSYLSLLDIAILAMATFKPWRRLLWGSYAGTLILYAGWFAEYYSMDQRLLTVFFAALFAAIFAVIPLVSHYERSTRLSGSSITFTLLPLMNAAAFFLELYVLYESQTVALTWFALVLGAVYLSIAAALKERFPTEDTKLINLVHVAIAIAFITVAIPLKLNAHWITIAWLVESAVLLWVSVRTQAAFLRYLALAALALGIFRLLCFDQLQADTLVFNARFATYVVAIAVLGGIAGFGKRHASQAERPFLDGAVIALNLLALIALTWEAADYFNRQAVTGRDYIARGFSYSAIWLIYGTALMTIGFWKRSAFVRWQALFLIAFTIGKVFLYDVSDLGGSYRIVSFIALGAVLLGISFIYQRDWLKLSSRSPENSSGDLG
ncbi:MAG TPA: DUF2339 domain-containing protein [Candidatus Dormibacteraeota bacterium]|nr:DUF2339 domain-containing protein [Candidatus Dormibacteraeota bacterium]